MQPTPDTTLRCQKCDCLFGGPCVYSNGSVQCTGCPPGHEGDRCQICGNGYYGKVVDAFGKLSRFVSNISSASPIYLLYDYS